MYTHRHAHTDIYAYFDFSRGTGIRPVCPDNESLMTVTVGTGSAVKRSECARHIHCSGNGYTFRV